MYLICLDLEGVLVPEIWEAVSHRTGIPELMRTTRDEPDYGKLMRYRLDILDQHGLLLPDIQDVIGSMDPLPGAKDFLDQLRSECQVIILSDTFEQFAKPLMKKLGWPTIFCNSLEVEENGRICGFSIRYGSSKADTLRGLQGIGYDTIAAGDSFNDLQMLCAAQAGILFRTTEAIRKAHPEFPAIETYDDFLTEIRRVINGKITAGRSR